MLILERVQLYISLSTYTTMVLVSVPIYSSLFMCTTIIAVQAIGLIHVLHEPVNGVSLGQRSHYEGLQELSSCCSLE